MKKNLAKKVTLSILAGAVLMSSSVVWAATNPDDVAGWTKDNSKYVWKGDFGGAPNGEVNGTGDTFTLDFFGAYDDGHVSDGKVTITDGQFNGIYVEGGLSTAGYAQWNNVKISGGKFDGVDVIGGDSTGDSSQDSRVENNTVEISKVDEDSTFASVSGGYSYSGIVDNNKVILSAVDATYDDSVYGGCSDGDSATSNTVNISGGSFTSDDEDNPVTVYGGFSGAGSATGNTVSIDDGVFEEVRVYGGFASGTPNNPGNASDNIVTISGGTVAGDVYGGFASGTPNNPAGDATGNTVTISGTANLENANLYGGATPLYIIPPGSTKPVFSGFVGVYGGNTLNIGVDDELKSQLATKGITVDVGAWNKNKVKSIQGFDVINFYNLEWNNGNTIVETEEAHLSPNGTKINVHVASGDMNLNESMTLIKSVSDITGKVHDDSEQPFEIFEGVDKVYEGQISQPDNKSIIVKIVGEDEVPGDGGGTGGEDSGTTGGGTGGTPEPERNDQVLVLGESRAAAVAFTNQGSELIELGLNALARDNSKDTKVFAAVYGNHSEYETGSHVNVNGWSGIVGIGKTNANGLTVGAFFENGEGNYSTHNDYNAQYIRGDGEANYNGGGLLVRKDNANGVYAEASLRAGNLQNELRNAVRNGQDLTGYDVDTFYYGAHIGIGKVIPRGADGDSLDIYGKFIYTHHDGETFDVGGTATKFDSVESERLRLGFRLNEVQTNKLSMYYGAAWEYEFNGDAHDKIASFDLETPSLEGSTVIGEVGMHYKASEKWSLDLNARAYTGQREGFSGSVQANYSF